MEKNVKRLPTWLGVVCVVVLFFGLRYAAAGWGIAGRVVQYFVTIAFARWALPVGERAGRVIPFVGVVTACGVALLLIFSVGIMVAPFFRPVENSVPQAVWAVVLLTPLLEETLFRGVVQRGLASGIGPTKAIVISAAIFAAVHQTPVQIAVALPAGLVLGALYHRTRTIVAPIAVHALNNAAAMLAGNIAFSGTARTIIYTLCAAVCVISIIFVVRRR